MKKVMFVLVVFFVFLQQTSSIAKSPEPIKQSECTFCDFTIQVTNWSIGINSNGNPVLNLTVVVTFDCFGIHASVTANFSIELKRSSHHSKYMIDREKYDYTILEQSGDIKIQDYINEIFDYLQREIVDNL